LANTNVASEAKDRLRIEHEKLNPKFLHQELMKEKNAILQANRRATERSSFTDV